ncbi:TetR family transcriptional regulator C-terminal domain-containing protein [Sphingomonas sp. JC676]|uniref:TetR family transcriptional regulator C-terminal domain-containing protein n=1 Tax=Sphingomonas sp. JC676 TaxID=2768065 RepID=UPI0016578C94|nr:TetR family transcriptional regulator C-terminal domain-containing protein [Sphingomonas sp. JC676]MBC9032728.1 TetR family transcriptional regulator C-terminal domain-containing protein [Sphingomonas sp. JC676]
MTRTAFTRAEPDERRASLIAATAKVLAELGAAGVSVRTISTEAGVSPGLLRHYFDGIDALIAETYRWTGERVRAALAASVEAAGPDPRPRLMAYVTASFGDPIADPRLLATWIAFWSLAKTNPAMDALHGEIYADYRAGIAALLGECGVDAGAVRLAAIGLTALVDGLWLELCLAPGVFTPEEASGIAGRWIAALLDGATWSAP